MARDTNRDQQILESALSGQTMLVIMAGQAVALSPKARVGDTMSEQLVRAANVMSVRQFRNNIEAKNVALAKSGKPPLTSDAIVAMWNEYTPDVQVDDLTYEASLRVGVNALEAANKIAKGATLDKATKDQIVLKVKENPKHRGAILAMIHTLVEESKIEKPKTKKGAVDLGDVL